MGHAPEAGPGDQGLNSSAAGKRRWLFLVSLVGVAVVSALVFYAVYRQRQTPVQYLTARVERGRIAATVSATGTVNAVITVQVCSQVSGNIQKLFADYNSPVTENQIIAQGECRHHRAGRQPGVR
jgi:HlyD family secretion protein